MRFVSIKLLSSYTAPSLEILNFINNKKLTSSTVGDLPNDKDIILRVIKQIEKNNIYDNDADKFKVQQNEEIILENIADKISEIIISSIINLNDN